MGIERSYNFRRVDDAVSTSGVVSAKALETLGAEGYRAVINLLPNDNQHAVAGEREIIESQGLEYIHIPVDFNQPTAADFEQFSAALDRVLGKKIHIHCAANWRVSAFYSLYELRRGRWTLSQALDFIHGIWRPSDHPGWSEFIDVIAEAGQGTATCRRDGAAPAER